ncbi:hypothetical protein GCM10009555_038330 [Acrocarpospora macrocephala]|uniref:Uncharacterized protein n=1 Tax=Acrocarpospora macrocephala TaxID=150177 RepID=A0A5M3WNJ4_9ACTN|nr:hypothetical protein [Acrocarpospora macrocephala]GES09719.1 hypothetical protein Amac_033150 [Acrocarpospora macrocephala]
MTAIRSAEDVRRIGVLIEASHRTIESALWSALPPGATLTTARVSNPVRPGSQDGSGAHPDPLAAGLDSVMTTEPQAVVVAIESAGLGAGLAGLRDIEHSLSTHAQVPVITMSGAVVEWLLVRPWLRHLALVAPVDPWTHEQFVRVLREASLQVGVGADEPLVDAAATSQQIIRAYRACAVSGPDAIVQWGGQGSDVVGDLTPWTRSPVVSSVRALLEVALDRMSRHATP